MGRLSRFNVVMILLTVSLCFSATATITYAAISTRVTTASEMVNIDGLGTITGTVTLTSGNVFLANEDGSKTNTQTKLYPAGYFAVPLSFTYTGDSRESGYQKVAVNTGTGSFSFSSMVVVCQGSGSGGAGTNSTQFGKYFTTAEIKCATTSNAEVITSSAANTNYYLFLVTKSPAASNLSNKGPLNYFTNSITSMTITFDVTAYSID